MKIPDREDGQGLVEYALMLALVAVVVIAILIILGPTVTVVYARVIGGFSGQSVTLSGGEVIVLGLEKDTLSGPPACGLTISGTALVGLQDGEIMTNQLVKARAYVGVNQTSLVLSATANGNGLADLGGASATDPNAPCGKVTFQLVP
jgi:pilus assembly protein Flp/PilA